MATNGYLGCFCLLAVWNNSAMNIGIEILAFSSLDVCVQMEFLGLCNGDEPTAFVLQWVSRALPKHVSQVALALP